MTVKPTVPSLVRQRRVAAFGAASALALGLALQLAAAGSAQAQDASATDGESLQGVVVTASRVQRSGFTAPTPVTTVGVEQINQRAPTTVGEVLANIPSFRPSSTPQTSGVNSRGGGIVTADLRGLGADRTLVLVNGRRFVGSTAEGTVDLKMIPTLLVQNVEVVTGGASAAWGSDAVAGVVNFILKDRIEGVQGTVQYGQSKYDDNIEYKASLATGGAFAGDKVRFVVGLDYLNNRGIKSQYTRDWGKREVGLITNPNYATNGLPNYIIAPAFHTANMTPGGIVVSGPLRGLAFGPNGTTYPFQFGQVFGSTMLGGTQEGENPLLAANLGAPLESLNSLAHVDFEFNDKLSAFAEFSVAWSKTGGNSQQSRDAGNLVIQRDNAYLPAQVRAQMTALGLANITIGRNSDDVGYIGLETQDQHYRGVGGFKGELGGSWTWDAYYQYGRNRYALRFGPNNRNQANWRNAVDAVLAPNGQVVCRSTLANPSNGCIPVNVFGNGSLQLNPYVFGSATFDMITEQQVAALNVQGEPLSTWGGPVSLAMGAEYRKEAVDAVSDPVSQTPQPNGSIGGWILGNQLPLKGSYNVKEVYAETVVPLASKQLGMESLDVNAAIRRTDYSIAGGVTTWKVGATAVPFETLRLRITRSRDIRAPNLSELFQAGGSSNTQVFDRVLGQNVQVREIQQGNESLKPEKADTFTAGFVLTPSALPRFNFSIDYFNIKVKDVIGSLGAPVVVNGCNAGNTLYCQSVRFNADGTIAFVVAQSLNLNGLRTSGLDFEAAYTLPAFGGDFSIRGLATYTDELTTIQPAGPVKREGRLSQHNRLTGVPKWRGNLDLTYRRDAWSVNLQTRYVGKGLFNPDLTEGAGAINTVNDNHVPAYVYFNLGAQYGFEVGGRKLEVYGLVNNLLDRAPPMIPSGAAGGSNESSTNAALYDVIGRVYKVGLRFQY